MSDATVCPECGAPVDPDARFCSSCGSVMVYPCPECGTEVGIEARFCPSCGHRLDRRVPRQEERKLVTVLFADLTGSTELGERLDPEHLRSVLNDYFQAMASVIEARGGRVEKYIGDAVMAVFGIPAMREDDPERALQAALDMRARLEELNGRLADSHGLRLQMRIGVNTGGVIAGTGEDQLMVTGDAVNVAARLQQAAAPGEIGVGERTHAAARDVFAFEPLPARSLKGKEEPIAAWRLLERVEAVRPRRTPWLSVRMVGRDRELSVLTSLFDSVVEERRPRLAMILGEAGVGKSRLVEEFLARAGSATGTALVVSGRCLSYGEGITYWALREMLWESAGILLSDPGSLAEAKLRKLVEDLLADSEAEERDRALFALATMAGIALEDNPLDRLSPESRGRELELAWPLFLSALARERPVVSLLEDLHWAEPPLFDMVERVVLRSSGPILLVTTGRPEVAEMRPRWSSRPEMSQIGLEPLTDDQSTELIHEMLPEVAAALRERVVARAEGNPFFAQEIVRHLIDRGVLRLDETGIIETGTGPPDIEIPDTVRTLLAARLDALPHEEKRLIQNAAVVGRVFWLNALEAMDGDVAVERVVNGLEGKGLVVTRPTSSLPGHTELSFNHWLTREVAYESIPLARRARLHAALAEWTEALAGDRAEEFAELIAHHREAAARPEDSSLAWPDREERDRLRARACAALIHAGQVARGRFAIDQAIGFADRALALAAEDSERLAAFELKADAEHGGVRADDAWADYMRALEIAEGVGDRGAVSRLRTNSTLLWSRYPGAFKGDEWRARGAEVVEGGLAEIGEDATTLEAGALVVGRANSRLSVRLRGWVTPLGGYDREAVVGDLERAVRVAETVGSELLLSHAIDSLFMVELEDGFCQSERMAERALAAADAMGDRWERHEMLVTAAMGFGLAGDFARAYRTALDAVRGAATLSAHQRMHGMGTAAAYLVALGRLADVVELTGGASDTIEEDGGVICNIGVLALGARRLALWEGGHRDELAATVGLLEGADVPSTGVPPGRLQMLEIVRPHVGLEETRRRLAEADPGDRAFARLWSLRIDLSLSALEGDGDRVGGLATEARALASSACAPYLGWLADWAEAVQGARAGDGDAVARARRALSSLEEYGERYTAARLAVDTLPFLEPGAARAWAEEDAPRLEAMGALASAEEARRFL